MTPLLMKLLSCDNLSVHKNSSAAILSVFFHNKWWTELTEKVMEEQMLLQVHRHFIGERKRHLFVKDFAS